MLLSAFTLTCPYSPCDRILIDCTSPSSEVSISVTRPEIASTDSERSRGLEFSTGMPGTSGTSAITGVSVSSARSNPPFRSVADASTEIGPTFNSLRSAVVA